MSNRKMICLIFALVIGFFGSASCQSPYLSGPGFREPNFFGPPPPASIQFGSRQNGFGQEQVPFGQGAYEGVTKGVKIIDKELEKEAKKVDKEEHKHEKHGFNEPANGYQQSFARDDTKSHIADESKKSEESPGMLKSFQTSMTDAWKSFTKIGGGGDKDRKKRSDGSLPSSTQASVELAEARSLAGIEQGTYSDNYNEYVYLKVPKSLVCSQ